MHNITSTSSIRTTFSIIAKFDPVISNRPVPSITKRTEKTVPNMKKAQANILYNDLPRTRNSNENSMGTVINSITVFSIIQRILRSINSPICSLSNLRVGIYAAEKQNQILRTFLLPIFYIPERLLY